MMKITKSREKLDSIRGEVISSTSGINFILVLERMGSAMILRKFNLNVKLRG